MNKNLLGFFMFSVAAVSATAWAADAPISTLYNQKCASCHGKDGKGAAPMAKMLKTDLSALDLTDPSTMEKKDEVLDEITRTGVGKMPSYSAKLKAEEIRALTAYIRSLAKPKS
jgi:mono/diheme cytochrome c family protein